MGQTQSASGQTSTVDAGDSEINTTPSFGGLGEPTKTGKIPGTRDTREQQQSKHERRRLSTISNRNIQLLAIRPRSEQDNFVDGLSSRRRSSLINLILGVPLQGPRFCDDLCSISSQMTECHNFGIEHFPEAYNAPSSVSSIEDISRLPEAHPMGLAPSQHRRRSSLGSLALAPSDNPAGNVPSRPTQLGGEVAPPGAEFRQQAFRKQALVSIDLARSFESNPGKPGAKRPPLFSSKGHQLENTPSGGTIDARAHRLGHPRISRGTRTLRRSGSELSLYSTGSTVSTARSQISNLSASRKHSSSILHETKIIILLQVCLPFMLAGLGNMSAGLVLNWVSHWPAFQTIPTLFVLLPPMVGLKGNIEMTMASRLSTMYNLKQLSTPEQQRHAYVSNLVLVLSQGIGLGMFAAFVSILCDAFMTCESLWAIGLTHRPVIVMASALSTAILLVIVSSIMVSLAIGSAHLLQVNPDNLSTLAAALYGDVSCVLVYGLVSDRLNELESMMLPIGVIILAAIALPCLLYTAYKFKETHSIALVSLPPMLISILVSLGSGACLSKYVHVFNLIALYHPVVNGFSANLIAVQASRVSTWLWCHALRRVSISRPMVGAQEPNKAFELATFTDAAKGDEKTVRGRISCIVNALMTSLRTIFWSFCNRSPNAVAARLLLCMLIPAQSIYFVTIWLVSPANQVYFTGPFYTIYVLMCLIQVSFLLTVCEPFMTFLMRRDLDPDVFGISTLMACADLTGTLCLVCAFKILAALDDPNAFIEVYLGHA